MSTTNLKQRWLPVSGVVAGVIWAVFTVAADLLLNEPDSEGDPVRLEQAFLDHQFAAWIMVLGSIYVAVAVVFFAAAAQRRLGAAPIGPAVLGGGVLLAVAMLVHQGVGRFALLAAAHHHDLPALRSLGYLDAVTWLFLGAGEGLFLLAVGVGALQLGALPRWLAVTTVVLGALALLGPGALLFFVLAPIWFVLTGRALHRRAGTEMADGAARSSGAVPGRGGGGREHLPA